jgi:hypothetical protein
MKQLDTMIQYGNNTDSTPYLIPGYFTVDNSADYADVVYADADAHDPNAHQLRGSYVIHESFRLYDNFIIQSVWLTLPLNYQLYDNSIFLVMEYIEPEGASFLPGFGDGEFIIPFANYEYPVNLFYKPGPEGLDMQSPYRIGAKVRGPDFDPLRISMIGVPDSENEKVYECPVGMKILHNVPLY